MTGTELAAALHADPAGPAGHPDDRPRRTGRIAPAAAGVCEVLRKPLLSARHRQEPSPATCIRPTDRPRLLATRRAAGQSRHEVLCFKCNPIHPSPKSFRNTRSRNGSCLENGPCNGPRARRRHEHEHLNDRTPGIALCRLEPRAPGWQRCAVRSAAGWPGSIPDAGFAATSMPRWHSMTACSPTSA